MRRSTLGHLAGAGVVLGGLFLLLTEKTARNEHVALPRRCVGKLLAWSVKAGMTRDRVRRIFGEPELMTSVGRGLIGGDVHTTTTDWYIRYGVTVSYFESGSPFDGGEEMEYERIEGGIG